MKNLTYSLAILTCAFYVSCQPKDDPPIFDVSISASLFDGPVDGRVMLLISTNDEAEPRFQISDNPGCW